MKNILFLFILFQSSFLFGQDIVNEIKLCEDEVTPSIVNVKNTSIYIEPNIFNQPESPPPTGPLGPGDRIIFWVHGFGGNYTRWAVAADEIRDTRDVTSLLPTYSQYSLDVAGGELHDNSLVTLGIPAMIANGTVDPMNNFIIAHSAGGVVSRATDAFYIDEGYADQDRMFGGIVTFGSPHQGAAIANNLDDVFTFADNACVVLKDGPRREAFSQNWILDLIGNSTGAEAVLNNICHFTSDNILPILLSDFNSGLSNDLAVGSSVLEDLNNVPSTIPRVAFHGIENEPVLWRMADSFKNDPNNSPAFMADDDQTAVDFANQNMLSYEMKYLAYDQIYYDLSNDGCAWWQIPLNPLGCLAGWVYDITDLDNFFGFGEDDALKVRDAYYDGWRWWGRANDEYKILIGALEYEPNEITYFCECVEEDDLGNIIDYFEVEVTNATGCDFGPNFDCQEMTSEIVNFTRIDHPTDGLVNAASAMAYPGADAGPDNAMIGSNHLQMRNDSNLGVKLNELFAGGHGLYFQTD